MPLETSAASVDPKSSASGVTAGPAVRRRIFLLEDHDQTRVTLSQLLERRGHQVARNPPSRARSPAWRRVITISLFGLPDGDGHKFMAEMHESHGLPGIALSGYGMDQDIARSRASGFFAHLTKPVDIHVLESAIAAAPHPCLAEAE